MSKHFCDRSQSNPFDNLQHFVRINSPWMQPGVLQQTATTFLILGLFYALLTWQSHYVNYIEEDLFAVHIFIYKKMKIKIEPQKRM